MAAVAAVAALVPTACGSIAGDAAGSSGPGGGPAAPATTGAPPAAGASSTPPSVGPTVRERLAVLRVDDRPTPIGRYRREDWPHWDDVDGNGCDTRQDALLRWTTTTPTLDPGRRCKVVSGTWVSPYDGAVATTPAEVEIDHVVPLAEAFRSGGWQWEAGLRRRFANDPAEVVPVSSRSNRSKGDDTPDEWRPSRVEAWCAYAERYLTVKATYDLTVTTSERDALGQMLDTCGPDSDAWP